MPGRKHKTTKKEAKQTARKSLAARGKSPKNYKVKTKIKKKK